MGGEAKPIRGEMAAITWALQKSNERDEERDEAQGIVILTDSLTTIQIIDRWTRQDFGPLWVTETNWDILKDMLEALRARRGDTTIAWVKAHTGDVGNEMADHMAGMGCGAREKRWDRELQPLALMGFDTGEQVSPHGWNAEATRKATDFYGEWARERLNRDDQVISTRSLVKKDRGREHLGYSLTCKGGVLTEFEKRAMLQARSACFPTEAHLARMNRKDWTEGRCKLCGGAIETYGHIQVGCRKLQDAHRTAHNMVAEATLAAMGLANKDLEIVPETTLGAWRGEGGRVPPEVSAFKPDAFITHKAKKLIIVWEFTRGMAEGDEEFDRRMEMKHQAYHGVLLHLRHELPDHEVLFQAVVMGVLTSVRQGDLNKQLEIMGITDKGKTEVGRAAAMAAVRANGYVLRQRKEKLAELGFGGR